MNKVPLHSRAGGVRRFSARCPPLYRWRLTAFSFTATLTSVEPRKSCLTFGKLGISHLYSSPYFQASASSQHGYDVANHNQLNPAVGSEADFATLVADLRRLAWGRCSISCQTTWASASRSIDGGWMCSRMVPVRVSRRALRHRMAADQRGVGEQSIAADLGDRYGRVLEKGEFRLSIASGAFYVHYYETKLPLNPRSYPLILEKVASILGEDEEREYFQELLSIINSMGSLPQRSHTQPDAIKLRAREKEVGKRRLARLLGDVPRVREAVETVLRELEGRKGVPESFDALDELLKRQVYRLSYWRVAAEEINYRRFFDINSLAAIRVEVPEVFEAAHQLVLKMVARAT